MSTTPRASTSSTSSAGTRASGPPASSWSSEIPVTGGEAAAALTQGVRVAFGVPSVRKHVVVALVANTLAFVAITALLLWGFFTLTGSLVDIVRPDDPDGFLSGLLGTLASVLGFVLNAFAVVMSFVIAPVLFSLLASIVLPVFNGAVWLAAREHAGGPAPATRDGALTATAKVVQTEVRRIVRFLCLTLLIVLGTFVLGFVPVVGILAPIVSMVLQFLLGATTLGWDLLSYHFEAHELTYAQQKAYVRSHRGLVSGMGAVAVLLCMIPIAQIVFLTTNVAGAGQVSAWLDGAPRRP